MQTLNKEFADIEGMETQNISKWVEKLNRLKIIKKEVQRNLGVANEKQAKYYNLRRESIYYEIEEQVLRSKKTS